MQWYMTQLSEHLWSQSQAEKVFMFTESALGLTKADIMAAEYIYDPDCWNFKRQNNMMKFASS